MRFTDTKSDTLNLRVAPSFKRALREAADREQRSMVNMLEVLLTEYFERKKINPNADNFTEFQDNKQAHFHQIKQGGIVN